MLKNCLLLLLIIFTFSCKNDPKSPTKQAPTNEQAKKKETPKPEPKAEFQDIETAPIDKKALNKVSQTVALSDGTSFDLQLPKGYSIYPVAEGLKRVRFFAHAPDGRLFATGMYNLTDNKRGKVYILEDWDESKKKFQTMTVWKGKLRNPNSVQFYTDTNGKDWLYLAVTDSLVRYPYTAGESNPSGIGEKIYDFPGEGFSYKYGGWHLTRTIDFHKDKLYVSVGSSCNLCEEKPEEISRAAILEMNPDGSNVQVFAKGLRNAVDIGWIEGKLYATNMMSDHMGWGKPNDPFYQVERGKHYGWPYCYEHERVMYEDDPAKQSENRKAKKIVKPNWERKNIKCEDVPKAYSLFEAHGSPLGFAYFNQKNSQLPKLNNYFLAALHGPTFPKADRDMGHHLVRFKKNHPPEPFIDGFFQNGKQYGRPCGIIQKDERSFYFSDDFKGVVYLVTHNP